MRLITTKGEFELSADFSAEYMRNNVLLSDTGEQTVPVTIPATSHNLFLLNYSNRMDALYKPLTELEVQFIDGMIVFLCNLVVNDIDLDDGINITLYMDTGGFYSRIARTNLADITCWQEISPNNGSLEANVDELIEMLREQYVSRNRSDIFHIAPVLTDHDYTLRYFPTGWSMEIEEVTRKLVLNGLLNLSINPVGFIPHDHNSIYDRFEGDIPQVHIESGMPVSIGKGYGMTPFVKLEYVIDTIFEVYGFQYDGQSILKEVDIRNICILNNVADAIYVGVLKIRDLLPDMSVKEFLEEIGKILGGRFVVDFTKQTAAFMFIDNMLSLPADMDITPYLAENPKMSMPEFKQLILSTEDEAQAQIQDDSLHIKELQLSLRKMTHFIQPFPFVWDWYIDSLFISFNIGNVIHKYSVVETDEGDIKERRERGVNKLMLADFPYKAKPTRFNANFDEYGYFMYYGCDYFFSKELAEKPSPQLPILPPHHEIESVYSTFTDLDIAIERYIPYAEFLKTSNIPVVAKMHFPLPILHQINQHTPKLLHGQQVLIEQINSIIGDNEAAQEVAFRTLREYKDR